MKPISIPNVRKTILRERSSEYAVIIPVLNEGDRLAKTLSSIPQCTATKVDIIIVDSNSSDTSTEPEKLRSYGVQSLLTTTKKGLGLALRIGLMHAIEAGYKGVITVDGNGKDDLSSLHRFIEKLSSGFDFVQGSRFIAGGNHSGTPLTRLIGIKTLIVPLIRLASGFSFTDPTNGYKGMSRNFILSNRVAPFRDQLSSFNLQFYLNIRAGLSCFQTTELPVVRQYPAKGPTPTKINGVVSHLRLVGELIYTALGGYTPSYDEEFAATSFAKRQSFVYAHKPMAIGKSIKKVA